MILVNEERCGCGSNDIFRATMPSGLYCANCGKEIKDNVVIEDKKQIKIEKNLKD